MSVNRFILCLSASLYLCVPSSKAAPTLVLTKSANPSAFTIPGSRLTYTLAWSNTDPSPPPPPPMVDIVWVVDSSGSMGPYQSRLAANATAFANILAGTDFRLAVTNFTAASSGVRSRPVDTSGALGTPSIGTGQWTTNPSVFSSMVQVGVGGSGDERGLRGLRETATHYSFRAGAVTVFILVTDDTENGGVSDLALTLGDMNAQGIKVYGIGCSSVSGTCCPAVATPYCGTGSITDGTGGFCGSICQTNWSIPMGLIADGILGYTGTGALSDDIPPGASYLSSNPPAKISGSRLDWNLGPLEAGSSGSAVVVVSITAALGSTVTNCAVLESSTGGPVTSCAAVAVVSPTPRPLMSLDKSASVPYISPGETLVYTLRYQNSGDGSASNVQLVDTLPTGAAFLGSNPPPSSGAWPLYSWNLGTLAPGPAGAVLVSLLIDPGTEGTALLNTGSLDFENAFAPGPVSSLSSSLVKVFVASPDLFLLDRNAINPQAGQTLGIRIGSSTGGRVSVHIYNSGGELVRTLMDFEAPFTRAWTLTWDGTNDQGDPVASGVYLLRYTSAGLSVTKRVAVLR